MTRAILLSKRNPMKSGIVRESSNLVKVLSLGATMIQEKSENPTKKGTNKNQGVPQL